MVIEILGWQFRVVWEYDLDQVSFRAYRGEAICPEAPEDSTWDEEPEVQGTCRRNFPYPIEIRTQSELYGREMIRQHVALIGHLYEESKAKMSNA